MRKKLYTYSANAICRLQKFWIYVQLQTRDLNGSPTAIGVTVRLTLGDRYSSLSLCKWIIYNDICMPNIIAFFISCIRI